MVSLFLCCLQKRYAHNALKRIQIVWKFMPLAVSPLRSAVGLSASILSRSEAGKGFSLNPSRGISLHCNLQCCRVFPLHFDMFRRHVEVESFAFVCRLNNKQLCFCWSPDQQTTWHKNAARPHLARVFFTRAYLYKLYYLKFWLVAEHQLVGNANVDS